VADEVQEQKVSSSESPIRRKSKKIIHRSLR